MPNDHAEKANAIEKVLTATTTIPVGVSAAKVFGITISDWIVILTLVLLLLQLLVWGTKAVKALVALFRKPKEAA